MIVHGHALGQLNPREAVAMEQFQGRLVKGLFLCAPTTATIHVLSGRVRESARERERDNHNHPPSWFSCLVTPCLFSAIIAALVSHHIACSPLAFPCCLRSLCYRCNSFGPKSATLNWLSFAPMWYHADTRFSNHGQSCSVQS